MGFSIEGMMEASYNLNKIIRSVLEPVGKTYDLNASQLTTLLAIEKTPKDSMSTLPDAADLNWKDIFKNLSNLACRGLIKQDSVESPNRLSVVLTDKGSRLAASAVNDINESVHELVTGIDSSETLAFLYAWETTSDFIAQLAPTDRTVANGQCSITKDDFDQ